MAKTAPRRKQQKRETNWVVIGGLIAAGVIAFGLLLFLALRTPPSTTLTGGGQSLADYCESNPDRCFAQGDENAPVTMVEVSDFGCGFCRNFHLDTAPQFKETYVEPGTVRWVGLPYALNSSTVPSATAGMCAGDQGLFFEFVDAMFAIESTEVRLSSAGFRQAAESANLDLDEFNNCLASGRFTTIVNQNREAARAADVTGTPTFFVNGEKLAGAQPLSAFSQAINASLNQSQ
ncbi:MAG: thioredoxin domain-containing protein [Chloroflexota bacterium]|jgi:protein-disulfide isomerase